LQDLAGLHAVEVVVEVELLDDGDEPLEVAGAARRGAALGAVPLFVPVQEVNRFDQTLVGDQVAAEAEVIDEGAVLMDGGVEEEPGVAAMEQEELVGSGEQMALALPAARRVGGRDVVVVLARAALSFGADGRRSGCCSMSRRCATSDFDSGSPCANSRPPPVTTSANPFWPTRIRSTKSSRASLSSSF